MNLWTEHTAPNGRKYWFNHSTNKSTWEKPDELKTQAEKLLDLLPWKEYTSSDGRKYWAHTITKQSTWSIPREVQDMLDRIEAEKNGAGFDLESVRSKGSTSPRTSSVTEYRIDQHAIPDFNSKEEAEAAFLRFLREANVQSDWTWDKAMRTLIHYPMYRALKTSTERKEAFTKYIEQKKREEYEAARALADRIKREFFKMLKQSGKVDIYTRYEQARMAFQDEAAWKALDSEERKRRDYFEDFIDELQQEEKEKEKQRRKEDVEKYERFIDDNNVEITEQTTWAEFQKNVSAVEGSEEFRDMDKLDALTVFQRRMHELEDRIIEEKRQYTEKNFRLERKRRDGFRRLLAELKEQSKLTIDTEWEELQDLIKDDPRYQRILLNKSGSTALDFYRDVIVGFEEEISEQRKLVNTMLNEVDAKLTSETSLDAFKEILSTHSKFSEIKTSYLQGIYETIIEMEKEREFEERRREERRMRRLYDDFKYLLKKYDVGPSSKWEEVEKLISTRSAYEAVPKEHRLEFFDRFMERFKDEYSEDENRKRRHSRSRSSERMTKKPTRRGERVTPIEEREEGEASTAEE